MHWVWKIIVKSRKKREGEDRARGSGGLLWAYLLCPYKRRLDPGMGRTEVSSKTFH